MVALDARSHIPRGGGGQHEEGVDDEDAHPLDADGDDDGEERGEGALVEEGGDAPAPSEGGIDGEHQEPVVEEAPGEEHEYEDRQQAHEISRRDGEDIADEIGGVFVEAPPSRHEHEAEGDGGGGEDADDRIGRRPALVLYPGDEEGKGDGKDEEGQEGRGDAQQHAEGDARKGTVTQGVGEKGHAV